VAEHLQNRCKVVMQNEPLGTGHALAQVPADWVARGDLLVLNGDLPLIRGETIGRLLVDHHSAGVAATLASPEDRARCDARVVRGPDGTLDRIVEFREASEDVRALAEINVGLYCFNGKRLLEALDRLRPNNQAGELYLTDVFRHLRPVQVLRISDPGEAIGVHDRVELAHAEKALRKRPLEGLMPQGVQAVRPC